MKNLLTLITLSLFIGICITACETDFDEICECRDIDYVELAFETDTLATSFTAFEVDSVIVRRLDPISGIAIDTTTYSSLYNDANVSKSISFSEVSYGENFKTFIYDVQLVNTGTNYLINNLQTVSTNLMACCASEITTAFEVNNLPYQMSKLEDFIISK